MRFFFFPSLHNLVKDLPFPSFSSAISFSSSSSLYSIVLTDEFIMLFCVFAHTRVLCALP